MGACTSHQVLAAQRPTGVSEAVLRPSIQHGDVVLSSQMTELKAGMAHLKDVTEGLKTQVSILQGRASLSSNIMDAGITLPGGTDMLLPSPSQRETTRQSDAQQITRLEAQVAELTARLSKTESALVELKGLKESWEARRAAEEFAKQLRKCEEDGIPMQLLGVRSSRPTSEVPSSTTSFADDLPLDGLPQMRFPRAPGQRHLPSVSRHGQPSSGGGSQQQGRVPKVKSAFAAQAAEPPANGMRHTPDSSEQLTPQHGAVQGHLSSRQVLPGQTSDANPPGCIHEELAPQTASLLNSTMRWSNNVRPSDQAVVEQVRQTGSFHLHNRAGATPAIRTAF